MKKKFLTLAAKRLIKKQKRERERGIKLILFFFLFFFPTVVHGIAIGEDVNKPRQPSKSNGLCRLLEPQEN